MAYRNKLYLLKQHMESKGYNNRAFFIDLLNSLLKDMDTSFFLNCNMVKEKTKITNIYYGGGTLCVDLKYTNDKGKIVTDTILLNMRTETFFTIENGIKESKQLMSIPMLYVTFLIYLETKGKNEYYMECYNKSCIRHLYDCDMNKIDSINNEKEFFYDYENDSFELKTKH